MVSGRGASREVAVRSKGRFRALAAALLVAVAGILTTFVSIAINGATDGNKRWPGPFRLIQMYAWPSVIVLTVLSVVVAIWLWRLDSGSGDEPTPGIRVRSGNVSQVTGSRTTNVTNIFGDVHHGAGQAPPALPEAARDDRDVQGLPEAVAQDMDVLAVVSDERADRPDWTARLAAVEGRDESVERQRSLREQVGLPETDVSGAEADFWCTGEPVEVSGDAVHDRKPYVDDLIRLLTETDARAIYLQGPSGIGKTGVVSKLLAELRAGVVAPTYRGSAYLPVFGYRPVNAAALVTAIGGQVRAGRDARLVENARRSAQPWRDVLDLALDGLAEPGVLVVIDNADELLDGDGRFADLELRGVVDRLLERQDHAVRLLLAGGPVGPDSDRSPAFCVVRRLDDGLPEPDDRNLLRALDAENAGRLKREPETTVIQLCRLVGGSPRALELLSALLSLAPDRAVRRILDDLRSRTTADATNDVRQQVLKRLEPDEVRILQALAIFGRPVTPEAIDDLLRPYVASLRSAGPLLRLHRVRLARRDDDGRFFLPPRDDQQAVLGTIDEGGPGDLTAPARHFTQIALSRLAADHFARHRPPKEEITGLDDLRSHSSEIDLRIQAGEYGRAMDLIDDLNERYLMRWGQGGVMIPRLELLRGKLSNCGEYRRRCALAWAFSRLRRPSEVIEHANAALPNARTRREVARLLHTIGYATFEQDQLDEAAAYYRRALLTIPLGYVGGAATTRAAVYIGLALVHTRFGEFDGALEVLRKVRLLLPFTFDRRDGDASLLRVAEVGQRGVIYFRLGKPNEAQACLARATRLAEASSLTLELADAHITQAHIHLAQSNWSGADQAAGAAGRIAAETGNLRLRRDVQEVLALAALCRGDLKQAGDAIRTAVRHDPNVDVLALQGTIALQQGDGPTAFAAFQRGLDLLHSPAERDYHLLDARGLILTGMAQSGNRPDLIDYAVTAFRAARAITAASGVVDRVTFLLTRMGTATAPVSSDVLAAAGRPPT